MPVGGVDGRRPEGIDRDVLDAESVDGLAGVMFR
jgi:hypothetical protein